MLTDLRDAVLEANVALFERGLATFTFGNASAIDRDSGLVVIKPSGVPYDDLSPEDLVITDLDGRTVEGKLRPSSDLATHLVLYRAFAAIGGIAHTHSHYATVFAQAGRAIPCFGTTHADYFRGAVPVTEPLAPEVIRGSYEAGTGEAIVRTMGDRPPLEMRATLVASHAPFCWGRSAGEAVDTAALLEEIARLAFHTLLIHPTVAPVDPRLLEKHFQRKHGPQATYGQS